MKKVFVALIVILIFTGVALPALAQDESEVVLRFFYSKTCPHCHEEMGFLKELEASGKFPQLKVYYHEVLDNETNRRLFAEVARACGEKARAVPTTFVGDEVIVGYGSYSDTGVRIEKEIEDCIEAGGCPDPLDKTQSCEKPPEEEKFINLPIFGRVDSTELSLPAFTMIIGALDGFNPCAFFVLLFLLSMLIHARSRIRMLIIGMTFVFFSGLIYFLFMAAWLNLFLIAGNLAYITLGAGALAVLIAIINIKDFFWFKKGVSLTIPDWAKPKLFARMRAMLKATSLGYMLLAAAILAISANMYELLCTAGFPMVFTRILTINKLSTLSYYLYLVFYNVVYVVPLFIIVLIFTVTLGAKKLTEEQGQTLKLASGLMMLGLGGVLLFNPELLNSLLTAAGLIAGAVVLSLIIVLLRRRKVI